jgi:D-Tyr-tRNAtyr deacylase
MEEESLGKEWGQLKLEEEEITWRQLILRVQNLQLMKKAQAQMKLQVIGMIGKILIISRSKDKL